jgi:hypothetical protein
MPRKDYNDLTVVNQKHLNLKKKFYLVYRPKPLGNIFSHKPSKYKYIPVKTAQEAVDRYKQWLWKKYNDKDVEVLNEISRIKEDLRYKPVQLVCWCVDENGEGLCHANVIRDFIYWLIDQE